MKGWQGPPPHRPSLSLSASRASRTIERRALAERVLVALAGGASATSPDLAARVSVAWADALTEELSK